MPKKKVKIRGALTKEERKNINKALKKLGHQVKETTFDYANKKTFRSYIYE